MLTANKGEWSELYALFKIFDLKRVAQADEDLNALTGQYYTFLKVLREDNPQELKIYNLESEGKVIIQDENGNVIKALDSSDLGQKTQSILENIRHSRSASFSIPSAQELMQEYQIEKIRASSSQKSDLVAIIHDRIRETKPELGFSIKSKLGGSSTLLNASSHTNFVFNVNGFHGDIDTINNIRGNSKLRYRLKAIKENGGNLEFNKISSEVFSNNLRYIDSAFAKVISELLIAYYSGRAKYVPALCNLVANQEISDMNESLIRHKVKDFLRAIALGMVPSREWDTYLSTYGGYIIVKEDGELVCYHLYNDDKFKDYLFNNTRLETASSTRHGFGKLYYDGEQLRIKLNLQIRFN